LAVFEYAESLKTWRDTSLDTTVRAQAIVNASAAIDEALVLDPDDLDLQEIALVLNSLD
jgi:hypothetical protein